MTAATAAGAARHGRGAMSAFDRRLFAESLPARRQLVGTVLFGLLAAALIVAQATLLTDVIVGASTGQSPRALVPGLTVLFVVVLARAALVAGPEITALQAADRTMKVTAPASTASTDTGGSCRASNSQTTAAPTSRRQARPVPAAPGTDGAPAALCSVRQEPEPPRNSDQRQRLTPAVAASGLGERGLRPGR